MTPEKDTRSPQERRRDQIAKLRQHHHTKITAKPKPRTKKTKSDTHDQARLQALQRQLQQTQSQIQKLSSQNHRLKQANHQLRTDMKSQRAQLETRRRQLDDFETHLNRQYIDLSSYVNSFTEYGLKFDPTHEFQRDFQDYANSQLALNLMLISAWRRTKHQIASYKGKAQLYDEEHRKAQIAENQMKTNQSNYAHMQNDLKRANDVLHQRVHNLKAENRHLKKRVTNQTYYRARNCFGILGQELEQETNLGAFQSELNNLNHHFQKVFNENTLKHEHDNNYLYGYVEKINDTYYFTDVNHETRAKVEVSDIQTESLHNNDAVKVQRTYNGKLILSQIYPLMRYLNSGKTLKLNAGKKPNTITPLNLSEAHHHTHNRASSKHQINAATVKLTNPDELAWLRKQNILIIGNKKIHRFIDAVKLYANVKHVDGYEDSLKQLAVSADSADIIFCLKGSVPHAVTTILEQTPERHDKTQYFYSAKPNEAVQRLNYCYVNRQK